MSIVEYAEAFATKVHAGQKRKFTNDPYIVHPAAVVALLESVGADDETLAAGWLHDVVEDCGVPLSLIARDFDGDVAHLVQALTDPPAVPGGPNREARKIETRERLARADRRAQDIKCADCIDNWPSIARYDPGFAVTFMREVAQLLPCLDRADPRLRDMMRLVLATYEREQLDEDLAAREVFNG